METGEKEKTPVVITDGQSGSKLWLALVRYGLIAAVIFIVGTTLMSAFSNLPALNQSSILSVFEPKLKHVELNDAAELAKVDQLIAAGHLQLARKILEEEELARGLTPEMSDKLDQVYLNQARYFARNGAKADATKLLELVPIESALYAEAQQLIKDLKAEPKTTKSEKKVHSITKQGAQVKHQR